MWLWTHFNSVEINPEINRVNGESWYIHAFQNLARTGSVSVTLEACHATKVQVAYKEW
jgi:hypothetical protein